MNSEKVLKTNEETIYALIKSNKSALAVIDEMLNCINVMNNSTVEMIELLLKICLDEAKENK